MRILTSTIIAIED